MGVGLTYTVKDGTLHLAGVLDEVADLAPLTDGKASPLRLNLRELRSINSLGLRRLIEVMRALGDWPIELYECPPVFIEAVNTVPLTVGGQARISRICSVLVPMCCDGGHQVLVTMQVKNLRVVGETVQLPRATCAVCREPLDLENGMEPDDYFFFLVV